jgi:tRNA threonylcarbamoyladenosine biosynthesis protein TsaB
MRTLALETTERIGSVAAFEDGRLLAQRTLTSEQRSAQSLIPAIGQLLEEFAWKAAEIDLIAVTDGPGSFTGLRVGVTAAKMLAYAAEAEVVGVNTLEVIAAQADIDSQVEHGAASLWTVMDAQRQQLFAARFERDPSDADSSGADPLWRMVEPTTIVDKDAWLARLDGLDASSHDGSASDERVSYAVQVSGPALGRLSDSLPAGTVLVDQARWAPKAAAVGLIGIARHRAGRCDDIWTLVPNYFRKSAAEEKWEAKAES